LEFGFYVRSQAKGGQNENIEINKRLILSWGSLYSFRAGIEICIPKVKLHNIKQQAVS
jgi:hypothetical protein